jgi:prolyl 4-hydroxylase
MMALLNSQLNQYSFRLFFYRYESHSIIHGRQFPLKGKYLANLFVHFQPSNIADGDDLPLYIVPGSEEAEIHEEKSKPPKPTLGVTNAHRYAGLGKLEDLAELLDNDPTQVDVLDSNGWTPLAEAVRAGYTDVVRLLVDRGANVNHILGSSAVPVWGLAEHLHTKEHLIYEILKSAGSKDDEPSGDNEVQEEVAPPGGDGEQEEVVPPGGDGEQEEVVPSGGDGEL